MICVDSIQKAAFSKIIFILFKKYNRQKIIVFGIEFIRIDAFSHQPRASANLPRLAYERANKDMASVFLLSD
jgi:hypothetical protein